jgi:hypothetical protein
MDKYAIICILTLVTFCVWHAVVGALVFIYTPDFRATPDMWLVYLDRCVFAGAISIFIFIHIVLIIWLYAVPLRHRKKMAQNDKEYRLSVLKKTKIQPIKKQSEGSLAYERIPIEETKEI